MAIQPDLYFISMAARLLDMHPQTLRKYERLGLVRPTRTVGAMRVYTSDEMERLRLIKHLVEDVGVNLAGVQRLLSIAEAVQRLRPLVREEGVRSEARRSGNRADWGDGRTMSLKKLRQCEGVRGTTSPDAASRRRERAARSEPP